MLLQSQLRRQDNLPLRRLGALRVRATLHHSAAPLCRIRRDCVYFLLRLRLLRLRLLRPIAAPNLPHLNSSERFKLCPLNSSRRSKTVPRRRKALFLEQESLPVFAVLPYGPAVWASRMGQPYGPAGGEPRMVLPARSIARSIPAGLTADSRRCMSPLRAAGIELGGPCINAAVALVLLCLVCGCGCCCCAGQSQRRRNQQRQVWT